MLQLLQELDLTLERAQHALFALLIWRGTRGQLDLLHRHKQACGRVHAEVDLAERTGADQCAFDPFDGPLAYGRPKSQQTHLNIEPMRIKRHTPCRDRGLASLVFLFAQGTLISDRLIVLFLVLLLPTFAFVDPLALVD